MDFGGWVVLGVIAILGIAGIQIAITSQRQSEMTAHLAALPDFASSQVVMGCDGQSGIAVDEATQKVCLLRRTGGQIAERILLPSELVSAEVIEDGNSITKTMRSSQLGGALVGGIALGGVGAIIGGLSGKKVTSNKIKRVELRLVVDDTTMPLHDIVFMNVEADKDGIVYTTAMAQARHWLGILDVLLKRADADSRAALVKASAAPQFVGTSSVADELGKLASLQAAGVLTKEEFDRQKSKLLASA